MQPAAITAGFCVLLALAAWLARPALAVPVVLLQAVTAAGWFRLNGMWPARQGIVLAFAAGLTTDIVLLALDGRHATAAGVGTLGVWGLLILALQLRQGGSGDERLYGFTVTVSATVGAVLAAGLLAAVSLTPDGGDEWAEGAPVIVGAVAVAVAVLVRAALPEPRLPEAASLGVAAFAATVSGFSTGALTGTGAAGALIAGGAGACALVGLRVASYDWPSRFVHLTAGVALPVTASAPAVYMLGRVLAG